MMQVLLLAVDLTSMRVVCLAMVAIMEQQHLMMQLECLCFMDVVPWKALLFLKPLT